MRRWATRLTVVPVVTVAMAAMIASGGSATASAARTHARTGAPAKVKAGGIWILQVAGGRCETDTFATHHAFSGATTDGTGNAGIDRGSTTLTMKWKAGTATGDVFAGTWSRKTGDYSGLYAHSGHKAAATLDPVASASCSKVTPTVTTTPGTTVMDLGSNITDAATVTGTAAVTPTGTVTFYVCGPDTVLAACTTAAGRPVGTPVPLTPGTGPSATAVSAGFFPTESGHFCFLGVYSGDSHYASASDGSTTDECFTVAQGPEE
jgi:hypothetical protein